MKPYNSLKQCNDVLIDGFPTKKDVILSMPFGESMYKAYTKVHPNNPQQRLHDKHLKKIVDDMNVLLSGDILRIIQDSDNPRKVFTVEKWINAWRMIYGQNVNIQSEKQQMLRLEAFLHDVGKALTHSKHPIRGQYLITRLKTKERDRVRNLLGEDSFNQIVKIIAFHDRFGVMSTGEASFGVLADTLDRGSHGTIGENTANILSHLMVLNLIDIAASIPYGLLCDKVGTVVDDWSDSCWLENSPLKRSGGDRRKFEKYLLELAAADDRVIDRIRRLLYETYCMARYWTKKNDINNFNEDIWPEVEEINFGQAAQNALNHVIGIHLDDFQEEFAHVVKIDYLLSLAIKITQQHWQKNQDPDGLAICLVNVIQKLVKQFGDLINRGNERHRIGIDLSVLKDTPEVQEQIATLLTGQIDETTYGLDWLTHEANAWPF